MKTMKLSKPTLWKSFTPRICIWSKTTDNSRTQLLVHISIKLSHPGGRHLLSQFYPAPSLPLADFTQPPTSPYDFHPGSPTSLAFLCRSRLPNALCPPSAYPNNLSLGQEKDPQGGIRDRDLTVALSPIFISDRQTSDILAYTCWSLI